MRAGVGVAMIAGLMILAVTVGGVSPADLTGVVVDAATGRPVVGAVVTLGADHTRTDERGQFRLPAVAVGAVGAVRVRAVGYARVTRGADTLRAMVRPIELTSLRPKAVYLSVYGIGSRTLRDPVLDLIDSTELNALVIDMKGDRGLIPYPSDAAKLAGPAARQVTTVPDLAALVTGFHNRGIYTIARIVVFKDDALASARPDLALHRRDGSRYRDREGLSWTDPYSAEVRRYNVGVAVEAAAAGFDEIQFDYIRLPDATGLAFPVADTEQNRTAAIGAFLRDADQALVAHNVFLAADIFGYVCWNLGDTRIGQQLNHLLDHVDYVSPMLYPSSFQFGIPGCRNPVEHPYEIVQRSLVRALERTKVSPLRFRPWLQAFRDYAFGGNAFQSGEVRAQINAAEDTGTDGWMLWNPQNRYARRDLLPAAVLLPPGMGLPAATDGADRNNPQPR